MRAAGLLPLLPLLLLLLLGVRSQENTDPEQALATRTTETTTTTPPASTRETSPTKPAPATSTVKPTTTATSQPTVSAATSAQSTTTTTATTTTTTSPGMASSPTAASPTTVAKSTLAASETSSGAAITPAPMPGQDSSSQSTASPKTSPAASSTAQQQPSTTASSGSSGSTTAAKSVVTDATSPAGAAGALGTSSPTPEPQGKQPLDHKSNTTVSTAATRTESPQSSEDCVVPPPQCATKQPPPSSSSPAQGSTPPTSPGSNKTVTPATGSLSPATTPMSQHGSKDTVPEATTMTTPGADQSTRDAGPASAKPSSASQSPASAQPPAPGDQTHQAETCTSGHPQPNISSSNELICKEEVQHTRPSIHLKEPRTCDEWTAASKNNSFFESFCSTAQQAFDASRDWCTVILTACERPSRQWAVRVVLHFPLDSGEVLVGLKEKKDRLEELGIVNITSDKMVEDMTIKDEFSTPLIITIITLAGSLLLVAAIYGCHQRLSQKKDQNIHPDVPGFDDGHVALIFNQRLTEEMQTMENGYHDNPTLEVMETSSEMQEKKVNLNGELGDSWIVPLDTLMKEDLEEEEDTHL